jgi:histidinol-phosphate aminotransferase
MVVLDEAYNNLPDAVQMDLHWLGSRTIASHAHFSKAYGLAGVRVGSLAHPDVADLMNRVRQPFNVTTIGRRPPPRWMITSSFGAASGESAGMRHIVEGLKRLQLEFVPSFGTSSASA